MSTHCKQLLIAPLLAAALVLVATPALAIAQSSNPAKASGQQLSAQIEQLEMARAADWNAALDPNVSPVRRGTFLNQMNKADLASKKLRHGFIVTPGELEDALWTPQKHISPEERAQLIRELKQARQQDDQNEQNMLNGLTWSRSAAPADTAIFDERKEQVDEVVRDLEIGGPVHWSAIKEALQVVSGPY